MSESIGNGVRVNFNLTLVNRRIKDRVRESFQDVGLLVVRTAKFYAPVSPTQKMVNASLKRKKRSKRRAVPGGLEKSIQCEVRPEGTCIFVPSNSPAGQYARYIHDQKGVKWYRRGIGTQRKGAQADEKFIERAITDKIEDVEKILARAITEGLNR